MNLNQRWVDSDSNNIRRLGLSSELCETCSGHSSSIVNRIVGQWSPPNTHPVYGSYVHTGAMMMFNHTKINTVMSEYIVRWYCGQDFAEQKVILSVYIARCSLFAGRMLPEEELLMLLPFPVSSFLINPLLIVLCLLCTAEDHAVALGLS